MPKSVTCGSPAAVEENVGGLQVTVEHAALVRMVDGAGNRRHEPCNARLPWQLPFARGRVCPLERQAGHKSAMLLLEAAALESRMLK